MYNEVAFCLFLVSFSIICNCQLSTNGQCFRNISTSEGSSVQTVFCCRNFEPIGASNTCKGCELGFTSNGSKCEPCPSGKYGEKCGETCYCHESERCHHTHGCVNDKEDKRFSGITKICTTTIQNLANEDITSREQMLIVIIILLGLLLLFDVLHKCCNMSVNPLKGNARKTNETEYAQPRDGQGIESVYNEIDELALNTITSRTSFHHSYLELPNILSSTLIGNTCSTPISICSTQVSPKSLPVQQKTQNKLHEHTHGQYSQEENECADVHICSTSFSQLRSIETMFEHRASSLQSNECIKNEYSFSKESTLIGFDRSMSNNKLTLKDVRSQARRINVVDNPIHHETVNRQPKSATLLSKRKTI